jgi:hypothetical protein
LAVAVLDCCAIFGQFEPVVGLLHVLLAMSLSSIPLQTWGSVGKCAIAFSEGCLDSFAVLNSRSGL